MAALALVALGLVLWFVYVRAPASASDPAVVLPGPAAGGDSLRVPSPGAARTGEPMAIEPALEVGRSEKMPRGEAKSFDERRLQGRGRIRGGIYAPPGVDFPQEWVLTVEPSTALVGRERAETRRLEFKNGEQEFALEELALGGYMLRARSFGLSTDQMHVLLAKPDEADLYVQMQLAPTTIVEGTVRYEDTTSAVGLELFLEPKPKGPRAATTTDSLGRFLFTDVHAGAYTLHFGRAENPVRPAIDVPVDGAPTRLADAIVPRMGELIVRVLIAQGVPAPGVTIDGYGDHGGRIDGVTGADGEYRARFLPAGRFTVNARFPDGRRVQGRQVIEPGVLGLLELVLDQ